MDAVAHKRALLAALTARLAADLDAARRAHAAAIEAATHDEARPENDKDTRGLEQSYLARGQAMRTAELEAALAEVAALAPRAFAADEPVALGALVEVEEDGASARFLVAPHGGGAALDGGAIQVVTPRSPLGRALVGRQVGDDVEVPLRGKVRRLAIVGLA